MSLGLRAIGCLTPCDGDGYMVNATDRALVRPPWDDAVDALVHACRDGLGRRLDGVYLRGSVAHGTAIEGFSDLDAFVLLEGEVREEDVSWEACASTRLVEQHPFLYDADLSLVPVAATESDPIRCVLKTQTLCIWGADRRHDYPRYRLGPVVVQHAFRIGADLGAALVLLERGTTSTERFALSRGIGRRMVRCGFELVMERERAYTRDLHPAWRAFERHYAEQSESMREAMEWGVFGERSESAIRGLVRRFGPWLAAEAEARFPVSDRADASANGPVGEAPLSNAAWPSPPDSAELGLPTPVDLRLGADELGHPMAYLCAAGKEFGFATSALAFLARFAAQTRFSLRDALTWDAQCTREEVLVFLGCLLRRGVLRVES